MCSIYVLYTEILVECLVLLRYIFSIYEISSLIQLILFLRIVIVLSWFGVDGREPRCGEDRSGGVSWVIMEPS